MKFLVPPAGELFCFRRPQSAPPAKPASRASQQTPSSAASQAPLSANAMPAVRKASNPRSSATPKASKPRFRAEPAPPKVAPFCLEKLRRPAKKLQPPQSGKAPVRKQTVAQPAKSKPSAMWSRPFRKAAPNGGFPNAGTPRMPKGGSPPPDISRGVAVSQNAANARGAARALPRVSRRTSAPRGSKPRRKTEVRPCG